MALKLKVFSIIPVSFVDCRNDVCAVFFLSGCNMHCPYCQNYPHYLSGKEITLEEIMNMLSDNWAVGAVKFTGGEPLLQGDSVIEVSKRLKREGYGIAIDTNGTKPKVVEELCRIGLLEAAVDLKAPKKKYKDITGLDAYDKVIETIKIFKEYNVDFEVRTTIAEPLLTIDDLREMASTLNKLGVKLWYFQVYRPVSHAKGLVRPDVVKLRKLVDELKEEYAIDIKLRV
mgnify:CR=1 FL=1